MPVIIRDQFAHTTPTPGFDQASWEEGMVRLLANGDDKNAPRRFWKVGIEPDGTTFIF